MSTPLRLAKGSGLTLGTVAMTMLGQVVTVPIYLSRWDAPTFGVWLMFQVMLGYLALWSMAFQQYTYAEVLKRGPDARDDVRRIYTAGLLAGYLIAAIEFAAVLSFAPSAVRAMLPADSGVPAESLVILLILFSILKFIMMPFGAITSQTISIYGHYPRSAAWGLFHVSATLFAPAGAVLLGADLMTAGLVHVGAYAVSGLLMVLDFGRLGWRYRLLTRTNIDWCGGFSSMLFCIPLAVRTFIESFRQQGFRILLGAYTGATEVTALATTRTFANILHQGLTTITAPLMPELMRYLVHRDQDRTEGAFAIVWLSVFVLLVPGVLLLCLIAEPFFLFWTRGEVNFDPVLFLTLLMVVLVFAAGQPAAAVLQGQNRIAWMVSATLVAAIGLGLFALLLVPPLGLRGAGLALLGAELCALAVTIMGGVRELQHAGMAFPMRSFALVVGTVAAVFALTLPAVTTLSDNTWAMALPFAANALFAVLYWATIPTLARNRIHTALGALRTRISKTPRSTPGSE